MSKNIEIFNTNTNFYTINQRANKMLQDGLIKAVQTTHNGILVSCYSETDKNYLESDFNNIK